MLLLCFIKQIPVSRRPLMTWIKWLLQGIVVPFTFRGITHPEPSMKYRKANRRVKFKLTEI